MAKRETTVRLSHQEREQLQDVKETMFGRHADDVPHGVVISTLCERFEKQHGLVIDGEPDE